MTAALDLDLSITVSTDAVDLRVVDTRADALAVFSELTPALQRQLAADAWSIGLRALGNARAQAREARLHEIGDRLLTDLDTKLERQLADHQQSIASALAAFFDPTDGSVSRRLADFVADEGALARQLAKHVGPDHSSLSSTLAGVLGEASPLLRRLATDGDDSIVKAIEDRLANAVAGSQRKLTRALDPTCEDGPIRRFPQAARTSLLAAINPDSPESPMAAIKSSLESLLQRNAARQEQLATETREAIARLDTRRTQQSKAPCGGFVFEDAVAELVIATVADGPYVAEPTGASAGSITRCKKGDVVVRFTAESAFDGAAVVFEAKRDGSYTVAQALAELEIARKNRDACAGVFVMAVSHAPIGFPRFARHGNNVLVQSAWSRTRAPHYERCIST